MKPVEAELRQCKVENVIHVQFTRGQGIPGSPLRLVDAWFTLDGKPIGEHDPELVPQAIARAFADFEDPRR